MCVWCTSLDDQIVLKSLNYKSPKRCDIIHKGHKMGICIFKIYSFLTDQRTHIIIGISTLNFLIAKVKYLLGWCPANAIYDPKTFFIIKKLFSQCLLVFLFKFSLTSSRNVILFVRLNFITYFALSFFFFFFWVGGFIEFLNFNKLIG